MLVKLGDNCIIETAAIQAVHNVPYIGRYGAEDRSRIVLEVAGEVVFVDCFMSAKDIYAIVTNKEEEKL